MKNTKNRLEQIQNYLLILIVLASLLSFGGVQAAPAIDDPLPTETVVSIEATTEATPTVVEPTPVVVEPTPTIVEPTPVVVEPTPVVVEPTPIVVEPTPIVVEPTPTVVEPTPTVYAIISADAPAAPTPLTPSGTITTGNPAFTWTKPAGATQYALYVYTTANVVKFASSAITPTCGTTTCSYTPTLNLTAGSYKWRVRAGNIDGWSLYSTWLNFTVSAPAAPTPLSPNGAGNGINPTFTWTRPAGVTQYALYVYINATPSVLKFGNYVTPTCNASTCSYTPTLNLTAGNYKWQVRAGNTIGWSAYSAWLNFTASAPAAPTPQSPSGAVFNSNPTFTWTKLAGATKYALYVNTVANVNIFASYWFTAVCGTSTCSYTPLLNLTAGSYKWQVRAYNSLGWGAFSTWLNFGVSLTGSGFNSQFNGSKANWVTPAEDPTVWNVTPTYLYTSGAAGHFSTIYYSQSSNEHFSSLDYSARLYRLGCDNCLNELIVRGEPTSISSYFEWNNAYYFGYRRDGSYEVWKCVSGSCGSLQYVTFTSAIVKGSAWNILRVTASGSTLKFYINDALIWTGTDTTFTTGHVGIDMYRDGASTGNTLYVDYATLTTTVSPVNEKAESDVISAEQAALNATANQQRGVNVSRMIAPTPK